MASDLYELVMQENKKMAEFYQKNHSAAAFVHGVFSQLVRMADEKRLPPEAFEVEAPYIGADEYLRGRITIKPEYR